ncbi:MAG: hypothetical protein LAP86_26025 [Acidobacteriia bacterium]|nr:hypothetical protein [Terriglobia bacterium]
MQIEWSEAEVLKSAGVGTEAEVAGFAEKIQHLPSHTLDNQRETTEPSTDDAAAVVAESLFSPFQVYPRQPDHFPIADN